MKEIDIKKAAISILLKEGNFDCSVLDIAQKANVSHSIIHYYYRTKEKLMLTVYEEILENFVSKRYDCLISQKNMKFEERIKKYLECTIDVLQEYPYLDIYIITKLRIQEYKRIFINKFPIPIDSLFPEISQFLKEKNNLQDNQQDFITDLFSITNYFYILVDFFKTSKMLVYNDIYCSKDYLVDRILGKLFIK